MDCEGETRRSCALVSLSWQTISKCYKRISYKVYGTSLIDAVCKILHAPKRFFGEVSFYAVSIGPNLVKDTVSHPSSLLLNEYHVINRAESSLDAAQHELFYKIVN